MIRDELTIKELIQSDAAWLFSLMNKAQVMEYIPDRFESIQEMEEVISWLIGNYPKKDYIRLTYKIVYKSADAGWISIGPLPSDETRQEIACNRQFFPS
jgi:RimJ/RimL family protein N-acetyltransferase